jgi:hypothetical protein
MDTIEDLEYGKFVEVTDIPNSTIRVSIQDISSSITIPISSTNYATIVDEASSSITYVGNAAIASLTSASVWQIKRIQVSGTQLIITWADGNSNFDNSWDDRATGVYS